MTFLRNAFYFILTNILVMFTIGVILNILTVGFGVNIDPRSFPGLLLLSAIVGSGGAFFSLMISKWSAKRMMGVQIIDPARATGEQKTLIDMIHRLARAANLPKMPEVGIYHSPEVNAFATGPSKSDSLVAVSTGLLGTMNWDEVEGVLGHEIAHVANGDMVGLTLIQGIVNTFVFFFAYLVSSVMSGNNDENRRSSGPNFFMFYLFQSVFGLLGSMVVAYYSRQREFRADRGSANLAGKGKMIAALSALKQQVNRVIPPQQNEQFANFKISGGRMRGFSALFASHPPLEQRIAALQNNP